MYFITLLKENTFKSSIIYYACQEEHHISVADLNLQTSMQFLQYVFALISPEKPFMSIWQQHHSRSQCNK